MLKYRVFYFIMLFVGVYFFAEYPEYIASLFLIIIIALPFLLYALNFIASRSVQMFLFPAAKTVSLNKIVFNVMIKNNSILPISKIKLLVSCKNGFGEDVIIEEIITSVPPLKSFEISTDIKSDHCGRINIEIQRAIFFDYLFLTTVSRKKLAKSFFNVVPPYHPISLEVKTGTHLDDNNTEYSQHKKGDDNSQVFDYHEYTYSDSLKNINWKLSLRLDKLMLKEFSDPLSSDVFLMLDLANGDDNDNVSKNIDSKLEVLHSISYWLSNSKTSQVIAWFDEAKNTVCQSEISSNEDFYNTLDDLYDANIHKHPLLLTNIFDRLSEKKPIHTFYLTGIINKDVVEDLLKLRILCKLTVIFINDNFDEPYIKTAQNIFNEYDIIFIQLEQSNIKQDLSKSLLEGGNNEK